MRHAFVLLGTLTLASQNTCEFHTGPEELTMQVQGTVTAADDGSPITGATVTVLFQGDRILATAETDASGPPFPGTPNEDGLGAIRQGFLEQSNVDPVRELIDLIQTQRGFELNSQVIRAADEALRTVSNLRR